MEMQLINKKPIIFRVNNFEYKFVKPYYLMVKGEFRLIKGVVKGSTLCWNVGGGVVTYWSIKRLLEKQIA